MASTDREILTRQIRDAVDILDLVGSYVSLRRSGSNYMGLCPFHQEKTPSFTVSPVRQTFRCYGCNAGGDVFTFVQMKENVDFLEARRMLAERAGINLELDRSTGQTGPGKQDLARANQWAQSVFRRWYESPQGGPAREYVAQRGISKESTEAFGLGLALEGFDSLIKQAQAARMDLGLLEAAGLVKKSDRGSYYDSFRHRLMFPIIDATSRVIGFGGRTLGDDQAKYLNTPATPLFDKGTSLFGLNRARQRMGEVGRAIVVEGYTDCIMAHQHGFAETVATLGTAMTESHAALLRRYTDRVTLIFDSDEAGQRAADRALSVAMSSGLDVTLTRVPEGKDPCDYLLQAGTEGFEAVLKGAMGALEFKWIQVAKDYEASATGPSRRRAIEAYLQQLAVWFGRGAIDQIQKGLLVNQLSKILALPERDLHRQLGQLAKRMGTQSASPLKAASTSAGGEVHGDGDSASMFGSGPNRTIGAEQEALRQVIEVLLNEPSFFAEVEAYLKPAAIRDPHLAAVARELAATLQSGEPLRIDELIGRFGTPQYGRLITELQARGERRGGYAAVIEGAMPCLQSYEHSRQAAISTDEIRRGRQRSNETSNGTQYTVQGEKGTNHGVPEGEDERLQALAESARQPRFTTTKARKRFLQQ